MTRLTRMGQPDLGYGVGLRKQHFDTLWDQLDAFDFFEVLSENFMAFGGKPREALRRVAAARPVVLHGVSMSIGSVAPLDEAYLADLFELIGEIRPRWFSDHLAFSSGFGVDYHDLLPLPFTEEAVDLVAERAARVQSRAKIPFLLENPSYYINYADSELSEAEFITEVVERADCGLLLDVNNVYVNAMNHGYDARAFIDALPLHRVVQIHMAGHIRTADLIIDTHGAPIAREVFDLYRYTIERTGPVTTLLEWDNDIPEISALARECEKIRAVGHSVHAAGRLDREADGNRSASWRP